MLDLIPFFFVSVGFPINVGAMYHRMLNYFLPDIISTICSIAFFFLSLRHVMPIFFMLECHYQHNVLFSLRLIVHIDSACLGLLCAAAATRGFPASNDSLAVAD